MACGGSCGCDDCSKARAPQGGVVAIESPARPREGKAWPWASESRGSSPDPHGVHPRLAKTRERRLGGALRPDGSSWESGGSSATATSVPGSLDDALGLRPPQSLERRLTPDEEAALLKAARGPGAAASPDSASYQGATTAAPAPAALAPPATAPSGPAPSVGAGAFPVAPFSVQPPGTSFGLGEFGSTNNRGKGGGGGPTPPPPAVPKTPDYFRIQGIDLGIGRPVQIESGVPQSAAPPGPPPCDCSCECIDSPTTMANFSLLPGMGSAGANFLQPPYYVQQSAASGSQRMAVLLSPGSAGSAGAAPGQFSTGALRVFSATMAQGSPLANVTAALSGIAGLQHAVASAANPTSYGGNADGPPGNALASAATTGQLLSAQVARVVASSGFQGSNVSSKSAGSAHAAGVTASGSVASIATTASKVDSLMAGFGSGLELDLGEVGQMIASGLASSGVLQDTFPVPGLVIVPGSALDIIGGGGGGDHEANPPPQEPPKKDPDPGGDDDGGTGGGGGAKPLELLADSQGATVTPAKPGGGAGLAPPLAPPLHPGGGAAGMLAMPAGSVSSVGAAPAGRPGPSSWQAATRSGGGFGGGAPAGSGLPNSAQSRGDPSRGYLGPQGSFPSQPEGGSTATLTPPAVQITSRMLKSSQFADQFGGSKGQAVEDPFSWGKPPPTPSTPAPKTPPVASTESGAPVATARTPGHGGLPGATPGALSPQASSTNSGGSKSVGIGVAGGGAGQVPSQRGFRLPATPSGTGGSPVPNGYGVLGRTPSPSEQSPGQAWAAAGPSAGRAIPEGSAGATSPLAPSREDGWGQSGGGAGGGRGGGGGTGIAHAAALRNQASQLRNMANRAKEAADRAAGDADRAANAADSKRWAAAFAEKTLANAIKKGLPEGQVKSLRDAANEAGKAAFSAQALARKAKAKERALDDGLGQIEKSAIKVEKSAKDAAAPIIETSRQADKRIQEEAARQLSEGQQHRNQRDRIRQEIADTKGSAQVLRRLQKTGDEVVSHLGGQRQIVSMLDQLDIEMAAQKGLEAANEQLNVQQEALQRKTPLQAWESKELRKLLADQGRRYADHEAWANRKEKLAKAALKKLRAFIGRLQRSPKGEPQPMTDDLKRAANYCAWILGKEPPYPEVEEVETDPWEFGDPNPWGFHEGEDGKAPPQSGEVPRAQQSEAPPQIAQASGSPCASSCSCSPPCMYGQACRCTETVPTVSPPGGAPQPPKPNDPQPETKGGDVPGGPGGEGGAGDSDGDKNGGGGGDVGGGGGRVAPEGFKYAPPKTPPPPPPLVGSPVMPDGSDAGTPAPEGRKYAPARGPLPPPVVPDGGRPSTETAGSSRGKVTGTGSQVAQVPVDATGGTGPGAGYSPCTPRISQEDLTNLRAQSEAQCTELYRMVWSMALHQPAAPGKHALEHCAGYYEARREAHQFIGEAAVRMSAVCMKTGASLQALRPASPAMGGAICVDDEFDLLLDSLSRIDLVVSALKELAAIVELELPVVEERELVGLEVCKAIIRAMQALTTYLRNLMWSADSAGLLIPVQLLNELTGDPVSESPFEYMDLDAVRVRHDLLVLLHARYLQDHVEEYLNWLSRTVDEIRFQAAWESLRAGLLAFGASAANRGAGPVIITPGRKGGMVINRLDDPWLEVQNELPAAEFLARKGMRVERLIQPKNTRGGDALVNGVEVELKTVRPGASSVTVRNSVSASVSREGQARTIVIDARGSGLSSSEALRGLNRITHVDVHRNKVDLVIVIGDQFIMSRRYP